MSTKKEKKDAVDRLEESIGFVGFLKDFFQSLPPQVEQLGLSDEGMSGIYWMLDGTVTNLKEVEEDFMKEVKPK